MREPMALPNQSSYRCSDGIGQRSSCSVDAVNTHADQLRVPLALYGATLCVCLVPILSDHYTVCENNQVRILKVRYGSHETSFIQSHPAAVVGDRE
jgi:hypothetical protein